METLSEAIEKRARERLSAALCNIADAVARTWQSEVGALTGKSDNGLLIQNLEALSNLIERRHSPRSRPEKVPWTGVFELAIERQKEEVLSKMDELQRTLLAGRKSADVEEEKSIDHLGVKS